MTYTLLMLDSAADNFSTLTTRYQPICLSWIREELSEDPGKAGVALRGEQFRGLRAISQKNKVQIVFGVNNVSSEVLILMVTPSASMSLHKRAELMAELLRREIVTQPLSGSRATGARVVDDFRGE